MCAIFGITTAITTNNLFNIRYGTLVPYVIDGSEFSCENKSKIYRYVMAEIPQFVYDLTITPQNSTPAKNTPEV